jgi:hypothetical protein
MEKQTNHRLTNTTILKIQNMSIHEQRKKNIMFPNLYPNITCTLCNTQSLDTWPRLLLVCPHPNIHKLGIKRHNNAVWELYKLFLSKKTSRCLTLINAGNQKNKQQDNIVPT